MYSKCVFQAVNVFHRLPAFTQQVRLMEGLGLLICLGATEGHIAMQDGRNSPSRSLHAILIPLGFYAHGCIEGWDVT